MITHSDGSIDTEGLAASHLRDLSAIRTPRESIRVNCPWNGEAGTNFDGTTHFCQYCGATDHKAWDEYWDDRDAPAHEIP